MSPSPKSAVRVSDVSASAYETLASCLLPTQHGHPVRHAVQPGTFAKLIKLGFLARTERSGADADRKATAVLASKAPWQTILAQLGAIAKEAASDEPVDTITDSGRAWIADVQAECEKRGHKEPEAWSGRCHRCLAAPKTK